jgi:hypothetical protein
VAALERAFATDARWQLALFHVSDFFLTAGLPQRLTAHVRSLREVDPIGAQELSARISFAEGDYAGAASSLRRALEGNPDAAQLWLRLVECEVMTGDFSAAARAAREGLARSPVDTRGSGAPSHVAELSLYRGDWEAFIREAPPVMRTLAQLVRSTERSSAVPRPSYFDGIGMAPLPVLAANYLLWLVEQGGPLPPEMETYPEVEVKLFAQGLWAERHGDSKTAATHYAAALAARGRSDLRMLFAHCLARAARANGELAVAVEACREIVAPRVYQPYRALLLPACG